MTEPADTLQVSNTTAKLKNSLFWIKLVLGLISGALSYFILRFFEYIAVYVLTPIMYLITYILVLAYLYLKMDKTNNIEFKPLALLAASYTGTWIIAYFVLGTAIFYFGW